METFEEKCVKKLQNEVKKDVENVWNLTKT